MNNFVDEFASEYLHDLALSHYLQWKSKVFNYRNRQQSASEDPFETSVGASYIVFYSVCWDDASKTLIKWHMNSSNPMIYNEILRFLNNFVDESASEYL